MKKFDVLEIKMIIDCKEKPIDDVYIIS